MKCEVVGVKLQKHKAFAVENTKTFQSLFFFTVKARVLVSKIFYSNGYFFILLFIYQNILDLMAVKCL